MREVVAALGRNGEDDEERRGHVAHGHLWVIRDDVKSIHEVRHGQCKHLSHEGLAEYVSRGGPKEPVLVSIRVCGHC
jgi:hypothetical protein